MEGAAARALASLPGRTGVSATSQEGKQLLCDPFELDGLMLRAYLPRLQMGGVEQLTLRFAHSSTAESRLRSELGLGQGRVLVFSVRAAQSVDFYPNFLLAQGGAYSGVYNAYFRHQSPNYVPS